VIAYNSKKFDLGRRNGELKKLLFVQHAGAGGALVSLAQILRNLDHNRFSSTVLLLRSDSQAVKLLQSCSAEVVVNDRLAQLRHVVGGWNSLRNPISLYHWLLNVMRLPMSLVGFRRVLENMQPDLVYLNSLTLFHYAYIARSLDIPVVLHVREVALNGIFGLRKRLHRRVIEKCVTHTIFIGEFERERLWITRSGEVISDYVDLRLWQASDQDSNKKLTNAAQPVILFAGGLNKIKGLSVLLQALAILKPGHPNFKCVILAFSPSSKRWSGLKRVLGGLGLVPRKRTTNFVKRTGLDQHCIFKSFVIDPVQEYTQADLLVFPSTAPHFPRPVIEAGAMGLPVVVSDLAGPRDLVAHGQNGLLVPPNDPEALAEALLKLLSNPQLRQEMGATGRRIVAERYNRAINEVRIFDIIERLSAETKAAA
jgi:glycosyltransferase involved in cell wall biosynthesis